MSEKNRPLYVLKYLLDNTDEDHPAIITDILAYLETIGIHANRKNVASDLLELQDSGYDVICNKSRRNKIRNLSRKVDMKKSEKVIW